MKATSVTEAFEKKNGLQLVPAGHRVLIRPDAVGDKIGSFFIPEAKKADEQRASDTGIIVAVGPQAWKAFCDGEPWAKVGDRVLFSTYAGRDIPKKLAYQYDSTAERLVLCNDEDVLLVMEGGEAKSYQDMDRSSKKRKSSGEFRHSLPTSADGYE